MSRSDATAEVLAVGDVFVNRKYPHTAFEHVRGAFGAADLRIGNLEGGLSELGEPVDLLGGPPLRSPPESLAAVRDVGFDIVSLANNHAMDYGRAALRDTVEALEDAGVGVAGAGTTGRAAERVCTRTANGVSVGVLGFDATQSTVKLGMQAKEGYPGINVLTVSPLFPEPYVSREDTERVERAVRTAADAVDVLFVLYHYGIPNSRTVTLPQRHLSHRAIEAGADAVIGAHPHTLQGVEVYDGAPICYSLGNFVFDSIADLFDSVASYDDLFDRETAFVRCSATPDGLASMTLHPTYIGDSDQPVPLDPEDGRYADVAAILQEASRREGTELEPTDRGLRVPL